MTFSAQEVRYFHIIEILGICKSPFVLMTMNTSWFQEDYVYLNLFLHKRCVEAQAAWWKHAQFRQSLNLYAANNTARVRDKSIHGFTSFVVQQLQMLVSHATTFIVPCTKCMRSW